MPNNQVDADAPSSLREGTNPSGRRKGFVPFASNSFLRDKSRGDVMIVGMGIALGVVCALFPWYVFFNQQKFGIRTLRFEGNGHESNRSLVSATQPRRLSEGGEMPMLTPPFDLMTTGVVLDHGWTAEAAPGIDEQPFPGEIVEFRLVHVANGRALMEDDSGLFIVQQGSRLPDNSHVARFEERDSGWVLVTSEDRIIESQP